MELKRIHGWKNIRKKCDTFASEFIKSDFLPKNEKLNPN